MFSFFCFQLDAKKSPLALLAQTCSQIGVDMPPNKSLLAPPDKSKSASKDPASREKASPLTHHHHSTSSASSTSSLESNKSSSFKPYESCISRDKAASSPEQQRVPSAHSGNSRSRTPGSAGKQRCSSNQSASSSGGGREMTPQGRKSSTPSSEPPTRESPGSRVPPTDPASSRSAAAGSPSQSKPAFSLAHGVLSSQDYFRPSALSLISSAASNGATTTTTPSAAAYGLPYPPQFAPMDPMTANSLLSQHHAALKNGLAGNPYLGYARMKTPAGADTLVPVCRDPYCTGCQPNSHLLGPASTPSSVGAAKLPPTSQAGQPTGACPAGCTQCDHGKSGGPSAAAAAAAVAAAAASPYAAYAQAHFMALAAASQMPYVCNFIGSDAAYCGKRFTSSDELLQHFRSHGAAPDSSAAAAAASTAAALSLLTPPGLGPAHPLLSRTYPTPPLSPLAAARYHPYGKPYGAPQLTGLGLPMVPPPHPAAAGLPPYFSPYASLYANSRLGAASGMHP